MKCLKYPFKLILSFFCGTLVAIYILQYLPVDLHRTFLRWPQDRVFISHDALVRYNCFGKTMALEIYGETNFLIAPELEDYRIQSVQYKDCVHQAGVVEYMPFPPIPGSVSI
jgi:hypothetical protein